MSGPLPTILSGGYDHKCACIDAPLHDVFLVVSKHFPADISAVFKLLKEALDGAIARAVQVRKIAIARPAVSLAIAQRRQLSI